MVVVKEAMVVKEAWLSKQRSPVMIPFAGVVWRSTEP
jgi:hypothetical protein